MIKMMILLYYIHLGKSMNFADFWGILRAETGGMTFIHRLRVILVRLRVILVRLRVILSGGRSPQSNFW